MKVYLLQKEDIVWGLHHAFSHDNSNWTVTFSYQIWTRVSFSVFDVAPIC